MSDPLPQQQQQPVLVYPNGVNLQPQSQTLPSAHSKGSFGASFIVLAVIIFVSAAACFLSRLCNKRGQKKHNKEPKQDKKHKQKKGQGDQGGPTIFLPQQSRRKEMDMEFGFGARVGPGPGFHHHQQQQQGRGNDIEFGFDKKSRQPKGSDIEMGFDKRFPSGKGGAPPNADMMRAQNKPYQLNGGEANPHFNGGRWPGGQ